LGSLFKTTRFTSRWLLSKGDFKHLRQGTGKALLFCGASNVIGFGSLMFSSSDALVSLGNVAVIGILLSMGISIFLLPGWSQKLRPGRSTRENF
jgi:predicted RND superfamily exporter protein